MIRIAYFVEIFPQSIVRVLSMHDASINRSVPKPGWTILTSVLFASSGWVNVLLWVITGRQFGFTASSTRTLSDDEAEGFASNPYAVKPPGETLPGMAFMELNQRHNSQREQGAVESASFHTPQQPSFPQSLPNSGGRPIHVHMPSSSTSYPETYHSDAYHPGAYDAYNDSQR